MHRFNDCMSTFIIIVTILPIILCERDSNQYIPWPRCIPLSALTMLTVHLFSLILIYMIRLNDIQKQSIIIYFSTNKLKYYDTLCKCKPRKLSLSPSFQQILQGQSMYLWENRALKTRLYRKNRMPNAYIRFLKQLKDVCIQ